MVHPAVYAAIVVGGVVIVGMKLYEEYLENKSYERFRKHQTHYEREFNRFHRNTNDFDFDDNREEDEGDIAAKGNEMSEVRKRKPFGSSSSKPNNEIKRSVIYENNQDEYELSELEASIAERKRRLMAEQAFLDQEEENLKNRKNALMKNNFDDVTSSMDQPKFSSSSSSSDNEDDAHSLRNHMTVFDPFADQLQDANDNITNNSLSNSDSTERMIIKANRRNSSEQQQLSLNSSTELRYPSPHINTSPTSNTTSVTDGEQPAVRASDSEESWDTVSELEDWNQSSAYESDGELQSHHSVASDTDEEDRLCF